MINIFEVNETNKMIEHENLDVRTITLGISLLDCIDSDLDKLNENIYTKITGLAKNLVSTGEEIEMYIIHNEESYDIIKTLILEDLENMMMGSSNSFVLNATIKNKVMKA